MPQLPETVTACLFDLDGVLTDTASVHRGAWKQMFDGYLRRRADETGEPFVEFTDRRLRPLRGRATPARRDAWPSSGPAASTSPRGRPTTRPARRR